MKKQSLYSSYSRLLSSTVWTVPIVKPENLYYLPEKMCMQRAQKLYSLEHSLEHMGDCVYHLLCSTDNLCNLPTVCINVLLCILRIKWSFHKQHLAFVMEIHDKHIIPLSSSNHLYFVMQAHLVLCEEGTENMEWMLWYCHVFSVMPVVWSRKINGMKLKSYRWIWNVISHPKRRT
jgi:hypothetical protein